MSRKTVTQAAVLALLLLAFLGLPGGARAGGVCGGTYVVEAGETLDSIAATCGTTVAAIQSANPGLGGSVYAGQAITVPGSPAPSYVSPAPVYGYTYPVTVDYSYYNYGYTNPYGASYPPPYGFTGTYYVQYGDTFSGLASRYGVSVDALWSANPQIQNINLLYVGQLVYVPAGGPVYYYPPAYSPVPAPTEPPALSYGSVPAGAPQGKVTLINKAQGDVYVSLQGTTRDGISVIREYPVDGTMTVKIPSGWYYYVAWVGGQQFNGSFNLGNGGEQAITFKANGVVVD